MVVNPKYIQLLVSYFRSASVHYELRIDGFFINIDKKLTFSAPLIDMSTYSNLKILLVL